MYVIGPVSTGAKVDRARARARGRERERERKKERTGEKE